LNCPDLACDLVKQASHLLPKTSVTHEQPNNRAKNMSFISTLKKAREEMRARQGDPWLLRLEGLKQEMG
jgi:hypothetical protein